MPVAPYLTVAPNGTYVKRPQVAQNRPEAEACREDSLRVRVCRVLDGALVDAGLRDAHVTVSGEGMGAAARDVVVPEVPGSGTQMCGRRIQLFGCALELLGGLRSRISRHLLTRR